MRILLPLMLILNCWSLEVYSQTKESLRFDGLYQTETDGDSRSFLRFYEDGTVISVTSPSEAKDLITWFRKEDYNKPYHSKGKYEIRDKNIYFTTSSEDGTVVFQGTVTNGYTITLKIKSLINSHEHEETYYFIKL